MKSLLLLSLATLFITGISSADNVTTTEPDTTSDSTVKPTEAPQTTTPEATTTESPEAPTTTSTEIPTTPSVPTTTPEVPTTTKGPVTTLSPAPTTKDPQPADCSFNITQRGVTCILADLKMSFVVSLEGKNYPIILGCNASTEMSDCSSNETQKLVFVDTNYNLTMVFEKESAKISVKEIEFGYNLPQGEGVVASNSSKIFTVKAGNAYLCKTKSDVHIGNVTIEISEIHVQAFMEKDAKNFGTAEECEADDKVSDVVPIAVGVALAALIIIVLIAYLVGRRRSRQMGYQSV